MTSGLKSTRRRLCFLAGWADPPESHTFGGSSNAAVPSTEPPPSLGYRKSSGLLDKMKQRAAKRNLSDLTIGPVLSWTTERLMDQVDNILKIPGAVLLQSPLCFRACGSAKGTKGLLGNSFAHLDALQVPRSSLEAAPLRTTASQSATVPSSRRPSLCPWRRR